MVKKFFIALLLGLTSNIMIQASNPATSVRIKIQRPSSPHGGHPRTPIAIPEVFIDGYTLTFDASCIGCSVDIIGEDGEIVYTDIVDENGIVELPINLTGTFELQFTRGSITFVGEIEL